MRHLPTVPWHGVTVGTVVLDERRTPRTVMANLSHPTLFGHRVLYLEGVATPLVTRDFVDAYPVELDAADAVGNLFADGFTVTPIEEKS